MVEDVNNEDGNVHTEINGNFNIHTSLWEYPAISQHKPLDMMDPHLVNKTGKCNEYAISSKLNADTGLYGVYDLIPSTMNDDGTEKKCLCGMTYHKQGILNKKGTLYIRNGPVQIKYYDIVCQRGLCTIPFTSAAKQKGIFIFTHATSAGDEIGWGFIHSVLRTKCSFTAYCNEMSRKYQTSNVLSGPFMSVKTFIAWFFGWISSFKIDFRKEVDPWCKGKPRMLACDGTHIGISMCNMKLDKPVTALDLKDTIIKPQHKRKKWLIIPLKEPRLHLRYLLKKYLKKLKPSEILRNDLEAERMGELLQYVNRNCPVAFYEVLLVFAQHSIIKFYTA